MALKHNIFDQTNKGNLITRKKVFSRDVDFEPVDNNLKINESYDSLEIQKKEPKKDSELISPKKVSNIETNFKKDSQIQNSIKELNQPSGLRQNLEKFEDFDEITGIQFELLSYFFDLAQTNGSRKTSKVSTKKLEKIFSFPINSIRSSIGRLISKSVLKRIEFRDGRAGYSIYEIDEATFQKLVVRKSIHPNIEDNRNKVESSTSIENNKNLKNEKSSNKWVINIPESLKGKVQLTFLNKLLDDGILDEASLDNSLWHFAYDLEHKLVNSRTGNTIAVLIGALKNGSYFSQKYSEILDGEVKEVIDRNAKVKKLTEILESKKYEEEFEEFRMKFPDEAEKLKGSFKIGSFEKGSLNYSGWIANFKNSKNI